jgi:hypothetical protein
VLDKQNDTTLQIHYAIRIIPGLEHYRNVLNQALKKIIDAIIDTNESEGIEQNLKDQTDRICLYLYHESFSI